MKSLNRAIARTVSQIARYAGDGCRVPMIMALENHLDALLTMERKMMEGGDLPAWTWTPQTVDRFNSADGKAVADWMRELERVKAPIQHANENAQPAPDVIDMTDPANWKVGDVVVCNDLRMTAYGKEFVIVSVEGAMLRLEDGEGYEFYFVDAGDHFQWLRHGEVQS